MAPEIIVVPDIGNVSAVSTFLHFLKWTCGSVSELKEKRAESLAHLKIKTVRVDKEFSPSEERIAE